MDSKCTKGLSNIIDIEDQAKALINSVNLDKMINEIGDRVYIMEEQNRSEKAEKERKRVIIPSSTETSSETPTSSEKSKKRRYTQMQKKLTDMAEQEAKIFKDLCDRSIQNDMRHIRNLAEIKKIQKEILYTLQTL